MYKMNAQLNSNGVNIAIKAHILDDEHMRKAGFTDRNPNHWYYCRFMPKPYDISFNVTIPKDGSDIKIDVLDENFLQPYDFQYYLSKNPENKFALDVQKFVYEQMKYLMKHSILSNWKPGDYI